MIDSYTRLVVVAAKPAQLLGSLEDGFKVWSLHMPMNRTWVKKLLRLQQIIQISPQNGGFAQTVDVLLQIASVPVVFVVAKLLQM